MNFKNIFTKNQTVQSVVSAYEEAPKPLPFIGGLEVKYQYWALGAGLLLSLVTTIGIAMHTLDRSSQMTQRINASTEVQMLSQRMSKNVQEAVSGTDKAFSEVSRDVQRLSEIVKALRSGGTDIKPLESQLANQLLPKMEEAMTKIEKLMPMLGNGKEDIVFLAQNASTLSDSFENIKRNLDDAYLLMLQRGDAGTGRVLALVSLGESLSKLSANLSYAAANRTVDVRIAASINANQQAAQATIDGLVKGSNAFGFTKVTDKEVLKILATVEERTQDYFAAARRVSVNAKAIAEAKNAGTDSLPYLETFYQDIKKLDSISRDELKGLNTLELYIYIGAFFSLMFIAGLALVNLKDSKIAAYYANKEKRETDDAVMQLITDLHPLSEGDLTVRLVVTEHVTGSIADKINSAIEQLQSAMIQIQTSSVETTRLVEAIKVLSVDTQDKVQEASELSHESSDLSSHGAGLVEDASERMLEARDKVQEVAKRVKRLGEVSQSIGRVSAIIEDVTEKTAILALNTSLKAEESGEAGKPFRVIADEIRKLSDSTLKALHEITDSVQSIQSETNVVIRTVESVTTSVVEGAKTWDEAKGALQLIKNTSADIDKMVADVNGFAGKQVDATQKATELIAQLQQATGQFNVKKQSFE